MTDTITEFRNKILPGASILFTMVLALLFTFLYVHKIAIPQYNSPKWDFGQDIASNLSAPGFAIFGNFNDSASAKFAGNWTTCSFPQFSGDGSTSCGTLFSNTTRSIDSGPYGSMSYFIFNGTSEASGLANFTSPSDQLLLQTIVNCTLT